MIAVRFLLRFLVVPFAASVAVFAALMVVVIAHWSRFAAIISADPNASDNLLLTVLFVGPAFFLIWSVGTVVMLLPGLIGIVISEAFAIRSWMFHVLAGGVAMWVGRLTTFDETRKQYEFFDDPATVVAAGIVAGFAYWVIAGWSAGFWKPVFAPPAPPPVPLPASPPRPPPAAVPHV